MNATSRRSLRILCGVYGQIEYKNFVCHLEQKLSIVADSHAAIRDSGSALSPSAHANHN